jgi:hypothetical protein
VVSGGDRCCAVIRFAQQELHIRLAGNEPNLANENVFKLELIIPLDHQRRGFSIWAQSIQTHNPIPVLIRRRPL